MTTKRQRRINRRAIYGSLMIWLTVQATQVLKPLGVPPFAPSALLCAGLIAFPLLVVWPWLQDLLRPRPRDDEQRLCDKQTETMVSLEIIALSGMLLALMFFAPWWRADES